MYRCKICRAESEPGQVRMLHRVMRANGTISQELPVCQKCNHELWFRSLADVLGDHATEPRATVHAAPIAPTPVPVQARSLAERINQSTRSAK